VKKEQQDRESSLERLMRDALRAGVSDVSDTSDTNRCLGAETLAAWAEQTLSARERTAVENHAADCARCQAVLAAMVRTTPVPVAAPWWRVHMMAWMVPVSAGAAALIVWTMLPARTMFEPRQAATQMAQPPAPAPAAAPPPASAFADQVAPQAKDESLREAPRKEAAADQTRAGQMNFRRPNADDKKDQTAVSSLAKTEATPAEPKGPAAAAAPAAERDTRAKAMADAMAVAQPPASPAAAPVAQPQAAGAAPAPAAPVPQPATAAPAPPTRSAIGGVAGATNAAEGRVDRLMARASAAPMAHIISPNPSNRWRLVSGGAVQHSTDGGSTWEAQSTGADVTLTAGASPAPLVCWLIGPRGRVLLSRDGATWKMVSIAEPIDLVSIRAIDDKSATVTAGDGRTFATADGGATWARQ